MKDQDQAARVPGVPGSEHGDLPRRSFLGLLGAVVGLRLKPDPVPSFDFVWTYEKPYFHGLDLAAGPDYAAYWASSATPWITITRARAREALQLSDDLAFIYEAPPR